ncbi:heterokaryon incompatibility protein-domain-containing protein [Lasiosphaeris hirsuta]|uniref:Heterokaryon incompatibility protein-domain-containing protein n=1 Tax=Lasiosphaeris hirsuta TaxID=260670 RepID=A0AA39ZVQ1_9PEZI|nr:heterokaryon incompatibility protein-domain-containing protein [Lasiosphaeris hirsuta]
MYLAHPARGAVAVTATAIVQANASVGFTLQTREDIMQSLSLYTVPGLKPLHSRLGHYLPPNLVPASEVSFSRARTWLEQCDRCHGGGSCKPLSQPYMPKRVMEIIASPSKNGSPTSIRTRLATATAPAPYAALSYCWGGDQASKTLKARVADYEQDIPLSTLPQTIQDALTVAHGIGLRYLWVDALCIVQDDYDDKDEQIAQMHKVYRGAYVTISAATASTSHEGFLQPRTQHRGFTLPARLDDNVFGNVLLMPKPKFRASGTATHEYPLFSRGWTFQEHSLSPRILIYGRREALFWCAQSTQRDGGAERPHWQSHDPYALSILSQGNLHDNTSAPPTHPHPHPAAWGALVEAYSDRALTVGDDKLPAVSAIAQAYADAHPEVTEYLAGLWREGFLEQCLWRAWDPAKTGRPGTYRAPSWSWAAVEGEVQPWDPGSVKEGVVVVGYCALVYVETTRTSSVYRFGMVKGGFMKVRARMRRVLWFNSDERRGGRYQPLNRAHGRDPAASDDELALLYQWGGKDPRLAVAIDVVAEWTPGVEVELWTLEVASWTSGDAEYPEGGEGLVVEAVVGSNDVFRRVGRISIESQEFMAEPYWFNDRESDMREVTIT